jgi:hypothetical protein
MPYLVVDIVAVTSSVQPPTTDVRYSVRNAGAQPVWLVDDGWLVFQQNGERIEVSFARARLQKGLQIFGYFAPAVVRLNAGEATDRCFTLTWPMLLDRMWNTDRIATPTPGPYQLSVRVGYGNTPQADEPNSGEDVDGGVQRWQRFAVSAPVPLTVPAY